MSTLTKILVVVMVVAAIVATVAFVSYVHNTSNYRNYALGQQSLAQAAQAQAQLAQNQLAAQQVALTSDINQKQAQINQQLATIDQLQGQRDNAMADKARLENTVESLKADLTSLKASLDTLTSMQGLVQTQLADARKINQTQNDQLRQQELRVNELTRSLEEATKTARVQRELVEERNRRIQQLESAYASGMAPADVRGPVVASGAQIEGTITAVRGNLAEVNVGSADGVTQGTRFILYRGGEYVGDLSVADVDANTSAGVLSNLQRTPQSGDKAATSLR